MNRMLSNKKATNKRIRYMRSHLSKRLELKYTLGNTW